MASSRQGGAKQKNRSEVRGGGKKPYDKKALEEQELELFEVLYGEVVE